MNLLREASSQLIRFGPFLDVTDGDTEETGLTIAQADMRLSKDGAAFAQKNAAGNATHDEKGWYSTTLNTTDTNTVGIVLFNVHVAGALNVSHEFYVVDAATYDALTSIGLNNITTAQVNTEVLDVLTVDTFTELASPPTATSSILDKISWVFSLSKNKSTQTSTTKALRNDGDSGNIGTSTVADDGTTFTRDKWS